MVFVAEGAEARGGAVGAAAGVEGDHAGAGAIEMLEEALDEKGDGMLAKIGGEEGEVEDLVGITRGGRGPERGAVGEG